MAGERLRLSGLIAALSIESDMAMGHPPDEAMRTCLLATSLARHFGLPEGQVADVFWTSLLMHVGCTALAHEQAALFGGDEIAMNAAGSKADFENPRDVFAMLAELGRGRGPVDRVTLFFLGLVRGERLGRAVATATCEVAATTARRIGLPESVQTGLLHLFERWDAKGVPEGRSGDAIALPARLAQVAAQAVVFDRLGGAEAAVEMVRRRSGTALDPRIGAAFAGCAREVLQAIHAGDPWEQVVETEPKPHRTIGPAGLDDVACAFGDIVDLKSVYTLGHSRTVATLAEAAGRALGLSHAEVKTLRHAGHLHDLGRVAIPNGVWEKPGPLTAGEWEQVRLHPYHSERILGRSPALAHLASMVGLHHERLDGTGYYRGATADQIPLAARILATADRYAGMVEARAYRDALEPAAAGEQLAAEAADGKLDADVVEAVLGAAGFDDVPPVRQGWPAGLTDREVDVLRLLARGRSNREIGSLLFISPKTVGRHVEHIYEKLEVSSRASAALFAVRHGILRGADSRALPG